MHSASRLALVLVCSLLLFVFFYDPIYPSSFHANGHTIVPRQSPSAPSPTGPSPTGPESPSQTSPSSTSTSTTSSTTSSSSSTTKTSSSTTTTTTTTTTTSSSSSPPNSTPSTGSTTGTDSGTLQSSPLSTASQTGSSTGPAQPSNTDPAPSTGIHTSTIIGLSVAGGIAVVGVIAFLVWKVTRKRFSDLDDDAIKWPPIENIVHAQPARPTGGAGIDTAGRQEMYGSDTATNSVADLHAPGGDPYAVPPLPHHDPNQPYRDDPYNTAPAFYDPYRGPVPQTIAQPQQWGMQGQGEAIPMSTYASNRTRSPAPAYAYDGRGSPAPAVAPGRRSPGPAMAYGDPRRPSPGPGQAYGGAPAPGRASPNAAYVSESDAYGGIS